MPVKNEVTGDSKKVPAREARCTYINPDTGKRCQNPLCNYPRYCARHTDKIDNVQVKKSSIDKAGLGLYAGSKGFKKGEPIVRYGYDKNLTKYGQIIQKCGYGHKCWEYVFCDETKKSLNNTVCWDGRSKRSTIARYANDCHGTGKKCNAQFEMIDGIPWIVATRKIEPKTEVYCNYGDEYWTNK
jgi:hypothetical protein